MLEGHDKEVSRRLADCQNLILKVSNPSSRRNEFGCYHLEASRFYYDSQTWLAFLSVAKSKSRRVYQASNIFLWGTWTDVVFDGAVNKRILRNEIAKTQTPGSFHTNPARRVTHFDDEQAKTSENLPNE